MLPAAVALWVLCADPTAPFVSTAGGFSALFPGSVHEQVKKQRTKAGAVETHLFHAETEQMGFLVSYSDHPAGGVKGVKPRARLAAARDRVVGEGKLIEEQELSLEGHPGLEFKFEKEGVMASERALVVGRRLYQVMAVGRSGELHHRAARIFLDSFKLSLAAQPRRQ